MQQIERDCFSVAKRRSIYTTLAFLALLGAPYIYEISSLRVNEELNDLYSSPNIIQVTKSRQMRWAGLVARMGDRKGVYMVW